MENVDFKEMRDHPEDVNGIPPWKEQITVRGIVASTLIGIIVSIMVMKLILTTGFVPNLNESAALLAFMFITTWNKLLHAANFVTTPFTRQEATIIQTCAAACYAISVGGGFGSYLLALSKRTYELVGVNTDGNSPGSYVEPRLDWMIGFLLVLSVVGLLAYPHLGKNMIIEWKFPYPSGTATADLINGFHTTKGNKTAKKQVKGFMKYFSLSFLWSFFKWFYSGGEQCGFINFPTLGLKAWKQRFYFDFSMTYIGAGMICSHLVNLSLLFGAVLSWGVMWPLVGEKKGDWFPQDIEESSMKSLNGYKVYISIALILGDGLYKFLKTMFFIMRGIQSACNNNNAVTDDQSQSLEDIQRNELFVKEIIIFTWKQWGIYTFFYVIFLIVVSIMFPQLKYLYLCTSCVVAVSLSVFNAFGAGLTGINMADNCSKVALFVLAALAGKDNGVVAALIGCAIVRSLISITSDLMRDYKTGHLTLTSPKSVLVSNGFGILIGCIAAPLTFFLFFKAFDVGNPAGEYKAPLALIYRSMAILGVEGFSALPSHCLQLCFGFFTFATLANLSRDTLPKKLGKWVPRKKLGKWVPRKKLGKWVPLPMAMAVPFLVGGYFVIDMCIGSLVVFIWHKMDRRQASMMIPAIASGLMFGDGMWILPSSILALAKIKPPICMSFMHS